MTNEKKYVEFFDIPDGNDGTERWHARDAEAQSALAQIPSTYATKTELQQTLEDAIEATSDANEAAESANDAAQAANEAAEAAAAAVVVAELPTVATESNVRAIVSGYSPSSSE